MAKEAHVYRMETDEHICPFGLRSVDLLEREGYEVVDHPLSSRKATDDFMDQHNVETTPQTFIDGKRIGGYDDLRAFFGKGDPKPEGPTYTPVLAIFGTAALTSFAFQFAAAGALFSLSTLMLFIALSMVMLAVQKLKDLYSFTNSFITYDLLAMRQIRYATVYPFLEAYAGLAMIAALPAWMVAPVALFIGTVGALSVIKAVYIDKRELKCACVGGDSQVPLGFVSLTENLFMIGGGLLMLFFGAA